MAMIIINRAAFTSAEAEAITGAAVTLQNNWRRRGFIRSFDGKHSRLEIADIVEIAVIAEFSAVGIPLQTAKEAASIAIFPITDLIEAHFMPEGIPASGGFDGSRYVIIDGSRVMRARKMAALDEDREERGGRIFVVLDMVRIAEEIKARLPRAPLTVIVRDA